MAIEIEWDEDLYATVRDTPCRNGCGRLIEADPDFPECSARCEREYNGWADAIEDRTMDRPTPYLNG